MTSNQSNTVETPAEALARSVFGFSVFALIPAIIAWIFFWLAPPSPNPTFRMIRWGIIISFGVLLLAMLWLTRFFYLKQPSELEAPAERFVKLFGNNWVAIGFVVLIVEINFAVFLLLRGIGGSITNPAKFLMVAWSLLLIGIIYIIHQKSVDNWFANTRTIWVSIGIMMVAVIIFGGLFVVNTWLVNLIGINDRLRGSLDYRHMEFVQDGNAPTPPEYWSEQSQTTVRWSPFTYWVMSEFDGNFINVSADGIRYTPQYENTGENIYVFGGSTVWGEGARDNYTIPSYLATLLNDNGIPQNVVNYGQSGYVSTQDLIWFQHQLTRGNVPDVVVFYQGFNDTLSSWAADVVGVTLQESMRLNDTEAGRRLRAGQPVLQLPNIDLNNYDMSQAGVVETTPQAIVDHWLANVEMVETLAEAYEIEVLFVWQPAIILKDTLSESEQAIYERTDNERAGLFELYDAVDALVRADVSSGSYDNILILSDLFADNTNTIFHDLVHITEVENGIVAEAIYPELVNRLEN